MAQTTLRLILGFELPDAGTIVNVVGVALIVLSAIPVYFAQKLAADPAAAGAPATAELPAP